jgi:hypothetical protein
MKLGYDDLIRNWLKARLNHMKLGYDDLIRKYRMYNYIALHTYYTMICLTCGVHFLQNHEFT